MLRFDRLLLTIALCVLLTILFSYGKQGLAVPGNESLYNIGTGVDFVEKEEPLVIVYDENIDKAIEQYFSSLETTPSNVLDEEQRILNSADLEPIKSSQEPKPVNGGKQFQYIVKPGDSIWALASRFKVSVGTIISANPGKKREIIHPGDKLSIPAENGLTYKVKNGDTLSGIAAKYRISINNIRDRNNIVGDNLKINQQLFLPGATPIKVRQYIKEKMFIMPVQGRITSSYGYRTHPITRKRSFHYGIDIAAPAGTAIKAAASGVVVFSSNSGGYGKMVILRHKEGYFSIYAHARKLLVRKGQAVRRGQKIAEIGDTGVATGNHLHFEIKRGRKKINPLVALKKKIKVVKKS